ncbi:MAG TPA: DUF4398 domain-containing protein [Gammaproteobacteria bacterium]|nr:DUF4398 domain-containing protein [Gammaproteobacteria bacterium]
MVVNDSIRAMKNALLIVLLAVAGLAGCGVAPVQEMSDARQAVRAAHDAGAEQKVPELYNQAETLLDKAVQELDEGDYDQARKAAVSAKKAALDALEQMNH